MMAGDAGHPAVGSESTIVVSWNTILAESQDA